MRRFGRRGALFAPRERASQIILAVLIIVCILGTVGVVALGRELPSEIVYRDAHGAVVITAPPGWVFSHDNHADPDLRAVLYPAGSTPTKALSVIYMKMVSKEGRPTLGSFIAGDVEHRSAASPGLKVVSGDPLPTARDSVAQVKHFSGANEFESVGYLETPGVYVIIILSSKTEVAQKEGQPAFAEVVKSYHLSTVMSGTVKK